MEAAAGGPVCQRCHAISEHAAARKEERLTSTRDHSCFKLKCSFRCQFHGTANLDLDLDSTRVTRGQWPCLMRRVMLLDVSRYISLHQALKLSIPRNRGFTCSRKMNVSTVWGPRRAYWASHPFCSAKIPSARTVLIRQSSGPV